MLTNFFIFPIFKTIILILIIHACITGVIKKTCVFCNIYFSFKHLLVSCIQSHWKQARQVVLTMDIWQKWLDDWMTKKRCQSKNLSNSPPQAQRTRICLWYVDPYDMSEKGWKARNGLNLRVSESAFKDVIEGKVQDAAALLAGRYLRRVGRETPHIKLVQDCIKHYISLSPNTTQSSKLSSHTSWNLY